MEAPIMLFRRLALVIWTAVFFLSLPGFGGTISGSVRDSSGATLGGVFITAQRGGVAFATTVYSDDSGRYRFPELLTGSYIVTAHAGGFQSMRRTNVAVTSASLPMDF